MFRLFTAAAALVFASATLSAQTLPQTAAQVKLLSTRTAELVTQVNRLTEENKTLRANVDTLSTYNKKVAVYLDDWVCKNNSFWISLTQKEHLDFILSGQKYELISGSSCADLTKPEPVFPDSEFRTHRAKPQYANMMKIWVAPTP